MMSFIPWRSVRARLAFWNVVTLIILLALFSVALRVGVEQVLINSLDRQLQDQIDPMVRRFNSPPPEPPEWQQGRWNDGGPEPPFGRGGDRGGRRFGGSFDGGNREGGPDRPFRNRGPFGPQGRGGPFNDPGDPRHFGDGPIGPLPPGVLRPQMFPGDQIPADLQRKAYSPTALSRAARVGPRRENALYHDEPVRIYTVPVYRNGRVEAIFQSAGSLVPLQKAVFGVTMTSLYLIPLALLLAGGGALALTNSALKPVRDLTSAADRIEGSNLSERLPVRGSDEFAQLAGILNAMLARIESAFARQKRFTADASHELRTPLAVIKVNTSLLLDDDQVTMEELMAGLKSIDQASDRAQRIVQDLLLLARGEGGSLPVQWAPVTLSEVLKTAASSVRSSRSTPTAAIELDVSPELQMVSDRDHLTRLFINLVENAARHTPSEGRIAVYALTENRRIRVTVTDTGEGIPAEHLSRITEPFYRVDGARARKSGGAGLGLSICRTIVDTFGGTMAIESSVGKGTSVTIDLPIAPPDR